MGHSSGWQGARLTVGTWYLFDGWLHGDTGFGVRQKQLCIPSRPLSLPLWLPWHTASISQTASLSVPKYLFYLSYAFEAPVFSCYSFPEQSVSWTPTASNVNNMLTTLESSLLTQTRRKLIQRTVRTNEDWLLDIILDAIMLLWLGFLKVLLEIILK